MASLMTNLKHAWNAFTNYEEERVPSVEYGGTYSARPDRYRPIIANEQSIVAAIYARLSIDAAAIMIKHIRVDDDAGYLSDVKSGLNECLTVQANLDQAARAFRQDIVLTMFDRGTVAIVPVDTTLDPDITGGFDILTMRVGEIVSWYPEHVRVNLYNEKTGRREEIVVAKKYCAIVDNPLYSVMNSPNSTLQRLLRKLQLLDVVDEQNSSGKLDIIVQLPYTVKSETRRQQAEQRRTDLEQQLVGSKYGVAYTDATEKITQLNRPVENNLLTQVEMLMEMLYAQLGLTKEVMNGTADETAMINYFNRTIEPIVGAIVEAMRRSFLTKTARSQNQSIQMFKDPFKLVSLEHLAEIGDKFGRNEILSPNDMRRILGLKPSSDPKANDLRNRNMPESTDPPADPTAPSVPATIQK